MGLADDLLKPAPGGGGGRCSVVGLLAVLTDKEQAAFEEALAKPPTQMPSTVIAERLQAHGHDISASSIQRHRRGACLCRR